MKKWETLNNETGSAVIIAVVFVLVLMTVVSSHFYDYMSSRATYRFANSRFESRRDAVLLTLKRNLRTGLLLYKSVLGTHKAENPGLYGCLFNDGGDPANDCDSAALPYPVAFYDDDNNKLSGGTADTAVCYNEDGALATGSEFCMFKVWTTFTPKCLEPLTVCNVAFSLDIKINVELFDSNGLSRKKRVISSIAALGDMHRNGQLGYIAYDFQTPSQLPWGINWYWFWWDGKPDEEPEPGDPLYGYLPCINVTGTPPLCGDGSAGFSNTPLPPPPPPPPGPSIPYVPPESSPCPSGQIYREGSCAEYTI